jgi:hypothetical protein
MRHRAAWFVGWLAVALQLGAFVAFAIEEHLQVQDEIWTDRLWEGGGAAALVAVALAFVTRPRGRGAFPALLAIGLMVVLPMIILSMLGDQS